MLTSIREIGTVMLLACGRIRMQDSLPSSPVVATTVWQPWTAASHACACIAKPLCASDPLGTASERPRCRLLHTATSDNPCMMDTARLTLPPEASPITRTSTRCHARMPPPLRHGAPPLQLFAAMQIHRWPSASPGIGGCLEEYRFRPCVFSLSTSGATNCHTPHPICMVFLEGEFEEDRRYFPPMETHEHKTP